MSNYQPNSAGIQALLTSADMQRFMAGQGESAAQIARSHSPEGGEIETEVVQAFSRWVANIINTDDEATLYEYGGRGIPAMAPLGQTLNALRGADPNNRKGFLARLLGR